MELLTRPHSSRHQAEYSYGGGILGGLGEEIRIWYPYNKSIDEPIQSWYLGDLFLNPERELIDCVMASIAATPQYNFQIKTDYPERALEYIQYCYHSTHELNQYLPLSNLMVGIKVTTQEEADYKIPLLLQIPAGIRFVSYESLAENLDLGLGKICYVCGGTGKHCDACSYTGWQIEPLVLGEEFDHIEFQSCMPDWIIVGNVDILPSLTKQTKDTKITLGLEQSPLPP